MGEMVRLSESLVNVFCPMRGPHPTCTDSDINPVRSPHVIESGASISTLCLALVCALKEFGVPSGAITGGGRKLL